MDIDSSMTTTDVSDEIVAPSHRVPPEIVVEIVHELLPINIDYNPRTQTSGKLCVAFRAFRA